MSASSASSSSLSSSASSSSAYVGDIGDDDVDNDGGVRAAVPDTVSPGKFPKGSAGQLPRPAG
eukprot:1785131-Karenia_brevis.AAC.1